MPEREVRDAAARMGPRRVEDDLGNTVGDHVIHHVWRTLFDGLVTFPDTYTRYVFQLEWPGSTPTVDAADIQGGTASAAGALAIQFPGAAGRGHVGGDRLRSPGGCGCA